MKIWFPTIRGGSGTDVYTLRLAEALQRRGMETDITWFHTYYQFAPFLLRATPEPPGTSIIVTNAWNGFAFKRKNIPLVVTEHGCVYDPLYQSHKNFAQRLFHEGLIKRFELASFNNASVITTVSAFNASSLERAAGIINVQVICNWVDTEKFTPAETSAGRSNGPFKLLFVGNLSRGKGANLLAPIMSKLGREFLLYFTSGLRAGKYKNYTYNMIPLGMLNEGEIIKAYQRCDALLFPTRFEGFGYAALEAMSCGKPVIASNASALPEVVEDGVTGILCKDGDVDLLVAACRRLAGDRILCERLGIAGRERAVLYFSEGAVIPQYMALYKDLVVGGH